MNNAYVKTLKIRSNFSVCMKISPFVTFKAISITIIANRYSLVQISLILAAIAIKWLKIRHIVIVLKGSIVMKMGRVLFALQILVMILERMLSELVDVTLLLIGYIRKV